MILRIVLYVIAAVLLGAHFYRAGDFALVGACVVAPLLFFLRRRGSLIALQVLAYGAAATWLGVAWRLVELRQQMGRPWLVAVLILGAVALLSLAAGLLLNSRSIATRYPA